MKKYIKANTVINVATFKVNILADSLEVNTSYSTASALDNSGFFDETEETNPQKDNSVWE